MSRRGSIASLANSVTGSPSGSPRDLRRETSGFLAKLKRPGKEDGGSLGASTDALPAFATMGASPRGSFLASGSGDGDYARSPGSSERHSPASGGGASALGASSAPLSNGDLITVRAQALRFVDLVPEAVRNSLSPEERMRQEVIYEFILSERQYVDDITFMVKVIMAEIKTRALMTQQEIGSLFMNIENILPLNAEFRKELDSLLEQREIVNEIGSIIVKYSNRFKIYAVYCSNQPYLIPRLEEYKKKSSALRSFIEESERRPEFRGTNLQAFLIKPLQRITKYPLLLRELLKNTPEYHSDYPNLEEAMNRIKKVVDQVNERTRKLESYKKIDELESALDKAKDLKLKELNRLFVRESEVNIRRANSKSEKFEEEYLFLFTDLLLETKKLRKDKYRLIKAHELIKLVVREIPASLAANAFEVIGMEDSNESCIIQVTSPAERTAWVEALTATRDEHTAKVQHREAELAQVKAQDILTKAKSVENKHSERLQALEAENAELRQRLASGGGGGSSARRLDSPAATLLRSKTEMASLAAELDLEVNSWESLAHALGIEADLLRSTPGSVAGSTDTLDMRDSGSYMVPTSSGGSGVQAVLQETIRLLQQENNGHLLTIDALEEDLRSVAEQYEVQLTAEQRDKEFLQNKVAQLERELDEMRAALAASASATTPSSPRTGSVSGAPTAAVPKSLVGSIKKPAPMAKAAAVPGAPATSISPTPVAKFPSMKPPPSSVAK